MKIDISSTQAKNAIKPHELFLINLVFNHVFMLIVTLTVANSLPFIVLLIPIISVSILGYTFWRAKRAHKIDDWYVMCHWQVSARWSRLFLVVLAGFATFLTIAVFARNYLGLSKIAMYAFVGGFGLLPTMIFILVLIAIESDALHQARNGKLPEWVINKYPQPAA